VHVPDAGAPAPAGGGGPLVLRLAEAAPRPGDARAWAATPDVAARLVAAGWPQDAVEPIAPLGIGAACGAGGGGVLVLLPDHDPAAAGALLDALAAGDHGAVRVVPTARTREVVAAVAARLPHAEVLRPVTDEQALAALAATADVVVAADPADRFDRRALVAAAAGAATVVRPGGPAVWVLGDAALVAEPRDAAALAAALAAADTTPAARRARSAAVHEACGADAARRALELLGVAPGAAVPARPDLGDFAWAPALRAERRAAGAATVSAVVNTLNEERNLGDALRSLAWADEVVVVDMHSDDATREIAARHGARVLLHERAGVVEPARDFAIAQATGEWILVLDADERVPEPLARQLDAIAREDAADVVDVPFRNWLCGRWLDATGWGGGDWHIRFFRRGAVRWGDRVHALPEVRGRRARLPVAEGNAILHFNYDDLHQFVAKTNRYTGKEAEAVAGGPTRPWADVVREARGELLARWSPGVDGTQSVALSMAMLFYRFLAGAKQWERHGFPDVGAPATARDALRDLAGEARLEHAAGLQAFDRGDVDAARGHLERAVREAVDPEALNDLAVACHAAGDLDQAEALLRTCLLVAPGHPAAGENLAAVLAERGAAAIG
jgi:tetratricopeptide (TPR) repeat protein